MCFHIPLEQRPRLLDPHFTSAANVVPVNRLAGFPILVFPFGPVKIMPRRVNSGRESPKTRAANLCFIHAETFHWPSMRRFWPFKLSCRIPTSEEATSAR